MARVVTLTESTQLKIQQDPFFSYFIDDVMIRFKHQEYDYNIDTPIDMGCYLNSSIYIEYIYPGGTLVASKSHNGEITANWFPYKD